MFFEQVESHALGKLARFVRADEVCHIKVGCVEYPGVNHADHVSTNKIVVFNVFNAKLYYNNS